MSKFEKFVAVALAFTLGSAGAIIMFELYDDFRVDIRRSGTEHGEHPIYVYATPGAIEATQRDVVRFSSTPFGEPQETAVTYHWDQFGMRAGSTHSEFPHPHTIALVGNSFTFGAEVDFGETLEARLEQGFPSVNVLNFGIPGSNSTYFARSTAGFLKRTGLQLDAAVVGLYTDMAVGDLPRTEAIERFGDRVVFDGVQMSHRRYDRLAASAWERVKFNAEVEARRLSATFNRLFPPKPAEGSSISLREQLTDYEMHAAWHARLLANLGDLVEETELYPSDIVVWLVPSNLDLVERWTARGRGRDPAAFVELTAKFWDSAADAIAAAGYIVVDPRAEIEALFLENGRYPFSASGHFRPEAYAVLADMVVPPLRRILEIPVSGEP